MKLFSTSTWFRTKNDIVLATNNSYDFLDLGEPQCTPDSACLLKFILHLWEELMR